MKVRQEKEILSKTSLKIESYWPVDPVTDEVEKVSRTTKIIHQNESL